jgi:hypothetical protein
LSLPGSPYSSGLSFPKWSLVSQQDPFKPPLKELRNAKKERRILKQGRQDEEEAENLSDYMKNPRQAIKEALEIQKKSFLEGVEKRRL